MSTYRVGYVRAGQFEPCLGVTSVPSISDARAERESQRLTADIDCWTQSDIDAIEVRAVEDGAERALLPIEAIALNKP